MRVGVLAAVGGTVAILVATGPASAFNSGVSPETYYGPAVSALNDHRNWESTEGYAYVPADGFTARLPDDEFDSLLLSMINQFRAQNGVPGLQESEDLRVQSAIWSNRIADAQDANAVDWWSSLDVKVACSAVSDLYTTSAFSFGKPEDVFNEWTETPAVRNALLNPGPTWTGIATVADDDREWTTMRMVQGSCDGGTLPYRSIPSPLPKPTIDLQVAPSGTALSFRIDRRGDDQLIVDLQHHDGQHWVSWHIYYVVPRTQTVRASLPPGLYRVSVGAQTGYAAAFTAPVTVSPPAEPPPAVSPPAGSPPAVSPPAVSP